MERSRLKMILILILALTDLFLAAYLIGLYAREQISIRHMESRLTALFRADGIILPRSAISRASPLSGAVLSRDTEQERAAAMFFLGPDAARIQSVQDDTRSYVNGESVARFYPGGGFTVTGLDIREDAESLCREFCRVHGYAQPEEFNIEDGVLSATAFYQDLPVYNCQLYFSFKDGVLREVLGTLLPRMEISPDAREASDLSAAGALALFQAQRRRAAVTRIDSVSACWIYESDGTETASLIPAWKIAADAGDYYINCVSGQVSGG